ncbi:MAG: transporter substrate-binding domain-containing protein [Marinobacter sp.]|nr:transporter substrate-binding domain-containing protein [Marinobacter sp.]
MTPPRHHPGRSLLCLALMWLFATSAIAVKSTEVITVGIVADNAPYSWVQDGEVTGFSIDVLEEIAAHTGLVFDYRAGSWPELYPAFLRGELDALDEVSFREDRAPLMLFTEPYHIRQTAIMHNINAPLPALEKLEDLRGYRVGIIRDIYYQNVLTERDLTLIEYESLPSLIRALAFGWVDAIVGPEVTLRFLANQAGFRTLAIAGQVPMDGYEEEDFRIAVLKDRPALHETLVKGLEAIPQQRLNELLESWQEFGGRQPPLQGFRLSEQHASYLRRLGPVRVGMMRDYAPFSFSETGVTRGLSMDMLHRMQDLSGLQVTLVTDQWHVLMEMFQRGDLDVMANMSRTPERLEFTRFSEPYHVIPNVAFTRDPHIQVTRLEDYQGLRIALGSGIYYEKPLKDAFGDAVMTFSDQRSMFDALAEGSVDVVLAALHNGNHWVRQLGLTDVRIAGELALEGYGGEDLRFGVRPALEPLVSILDLTLAAITPTEKRTIEDRWLGASAQASRGTEGPTRLTLSDAEQAFLDSRQRRLTLCVDPAWMPLEAIDKRGNHIGISADFFRLFADRLDVTFEVFPARTWPEVMTAVRAYQCDILPLAMRTPERLRFLNFTSPYYEVPNVVLARTEAPFVQGMTDLNQQRVGVVTDYAFAELLRTQHPGIQFVDVAHELDGLRRVQQGELYGFVSSLATASHAIQEHGLADLKVIGRIPADWSLSIATRNDHPELLSIAQKLVDSISETERRVIETRWRGIQLEERMDYRLLWQVLIAVTFALSLLVLWNWKLGSLNRQLALANEELERLSTTDNLTGVGNRTYFDRELNRAFKWHQRHNKGFALAMVDADHFKLINDTHGHQAGDQVLKALAGLMRDHFRRDTDCIARFGGEEFVIFTACDDPAETEARFEQLRARVAESPTSVPGGTIRLTISVGLCLGNAGPNTHWEAYLHKADHALYDAKRGGRNRVVVVKAE